MMRIKGHLTTLFYHDKRYKCRFFVDEFCHRRVQFLYLEYPTLVPSIMTAFRQRLDALPGHGSELEGLYG